MRPWTFVTISEPCPVVLYFPDHSLLSPSQEPARPERGVYQRDRVPGDFGCSIRRWPEFRGRLLDERGGEREEDHQLGKQVAGLAAGQVIRWRSWHRWTAICLLAYIYYLAVAVALQPA